MTSDYRSGFVGLVGLPNAGKSSFLNHVLDEKVSIVSGKPQATRRRINGILTLEQTQIIFVDSPGFLTDGKNAMTKYISEEAKEVISDVDAILVFLPCNIRISKEFKSLLEVVKSSGKPWGLCITKLDQKPDIQVIQLKKNWDNTDVPVFEFSTEDPKPSSLSKMNTFLHDVLPETQGPLYDPELFTNENMRDLVSEFIREPCFEFLSEEIPFGIGIRIQKYEETKKLTRIEASILVEKYNHKAIVIGKNGSMLKQIGQYAREKIEALVGGKVYLGLHVAHRESWTKKGSFMKELGYDKKA